MRKDDLCNQCLGKLFSYSAYPIRSIITDLSFDLIQVAGSPCRICAGSSVQPIPAIELGMRRPFPKEVTTLCVNLRDLLEPYAYARALRSKLNHWLQTQRFLGKSVDNF